MCPIILNTESWTSNPVEKRTVNNVRNNEVLHALILSYDAGLMGHPV